jgi:hypothetical protein
MVNDRPRTSWRCWRLWYQGPPGLRAFYLYRDSSGRHLRPLLSMLPTGLLFGTQRHYAMWRWRWPKRTA